MYCDLETTGLDPRLPHVTVRIISIDGDVYDVFMGDEDDALKRLEAHKNDTFVAHNAQFDLDFLAECFGYHHEGPIFDTMVAYQMLTNGRGDSASLGNVARKVLGVKVDKNYQKIDWGAPFLEPAAFEYAAKDTKLLMELHPKLEEALHNVSNIYGGNTLYDLFRLEMDVLKCLLATKRRGVKIDVDAAVDLKERLSRESTEKINILHKNGLHLNPRSPAQVATYFNLPDSTEDTIREFAVKNATLAEVARVRKLLKKESSVKKQILDRVAYDGRIHTTFKQTFTETGRLSSSEPNIQNVDRGSDVRRLFIPEEGNKFIICDYSQLELRLAALFSGDRNMLTAFKDGRDIHSETCARIFGKETKTTRTLSKNINFGLVFGGGSGTLVKFAAKSGVAITDGEARDYKKAFEEAYPQLLEWQRRQGDTKPRYTYSKLGRRRFVPPGDGYCVRINHIVQASAADGMKIALQYLFRFDSIIPVLSVHDEIILEVDESKAEEISDVLRGRMIQAMYKATRQDETNPVVPIEVGVDIGNNWSDKS